MCKIRLHPYPLHPLFHGSFNPLHDIVHRFLFVWIFMWFNVSLSPKYYRSQYLPYPGRQLHRTHRNLGYHHSLTTVPFFESASSLLRHPPGTCRTKQRFIALNCSTGSCSGNHINDRALHFISRLNGFDIGIIAGLKADHIGKFRSKIGV